MQALKGLHRLTAHSRRLPAAALRPIHAVFQHPENGVRPQLKALLLDAAGTLISPSEPAAQVYLRYAAKYGCSYNEADVLRNFRRAFNAPWALSTLRYVGDGRPFWRFIVEQSTGCTEPALFEEVYTYYSLPEAWSVTPGAVDALRLLRRQGLKLAIVSNFDTRLRPLLDGLGLSGLFDAIAISAEVGAEKPNPVLFEAACVAIGVEPHEAIHVGDDRRNDVFGARDAGCFAWLWGSDVTNFADLANRVLTQDLD